MAAASFPNNSSNPPTIHSFANGLDPDTTFVLADPNTFRDVVQRLTGAAAGENAHLSSAFNLHKRRPAARKLEIKLHHDNGGGALHNRSSSSGNHGSSPVSPLEHAAARGSPTEEEEMAIAAKGFYFHRSSLSTPPGSDPPELLPLFPLHSPTKDYESSSF